MFTDNLLDKYGIEYHVVKTNPNGVRIGFVPKHDKKGKRSGIGQTWFPKDWTEKDIKRAGSQVTSQKGNRHVSNGGIVYGNYKGVRVGVIRTNGKISTVFPDSNQTPVLNKRRKRK